MVTSASCDKGLCMVSPKPPTRSDNEYAVCTRSERCNGNALMQRDAETLFTALKRLLTKMKVICSGERSDQTDPPSPQLLESVESALRRRCAQIERICSPVPRYLASSRPTSLMRSAPLPGLTL